MKVLLDESIPRDLRGHLGGHEVRTVPELGWQGEQDGRLLKLAAATFDAFITADKSLPFQQHLSDHDLKIVILKAPTNRLVDYLPLLPEIQDSLFVARPGEAVVVDSTESGQAR